MADQFNGNKFGLLVSLRQYSWIVYPAFLILSGLISFNVAQQESKTELNSVDRRVTAIETQRQVDQQSLKDLAIQVAISNTKLDDLAKEVNDKFAMVQQNLDRIFQYQKSRK